MAVVDVGGDVVERDLLVHPGAVVIVPVLDDGRILMVYQYRIGPRDWLYELPAGTIEEGEEPLETARRELVEETGYEAAELVKLFEMYSSPGTSTEVLHVFLARGLRYVGERPERYEAIRTVAVTLDEALEMVRSGVIRDAKTIAALLYYYVYVHRP